MVTPKSFIVIFCFLAGSMFTGCEPIYLVPTRTSIPTPSFTEVPAPTSVRLDTGWKLLQSGLERRTFNILDDKNKWIESLHVFRLDPSQYRLDIAYHQTPQTLREWQVETNALMVVNGGYFRIENDTKGQQGANGKYVPNGLTIVNGEVIGNSYDNYAGMLAITNDGPELRWLAQKPYAPTEALWAALQSFPILVKPGGKLGFPKQNDDQVEARRTVIGQDGQGRILFMIAPKGYFTLHQLSVYLTESDLDLDIAINLDGGPSSGILVANPPEEISAQALLPVVIVVYRQ